MDPNECLRLMSEAADRQEWSDHFGNLVGWVNRGGFLPEKNVTPHPDLPPFMRENVEKFNLLLESKRRGFVVFAHIG